MPADISWKQLGIQVFAFLLIGVLVYGLTKIMRFRYRGWSIADARRSAWSALAAILLPMVFITVIGWAMSRQATRPASDTQIIHTGWSVINQLIAYILFCGPAILVLRARRESWDSVGITTHNLIKGLLIGSLLAVATVLTCSECLKGITAGLNANHFWALLQFTVVGVSEEFLFRGYLQSRLMAWLGQWRGWLLASILMALVHVAQRMVVGGLNPLAALVSSASLLPISLLMGYVLLRTENIVAPAIFHTFADWVGIFS
jgi:membrane protease YdiL (CAAX protease family)